MSSAAQMLTPRRSLAPLKEGEDGLFTQSWFAVCLSTDVESGGFAGFDFLGGRVIVMRDSDGRASVLSAYCPHLGADLCGGEMVDGALRCPFHHWRYGPDGKCVSTGSGDPIPPTAKLFRFPTVEKYGFVFAFNGTEPSFELPDLPRAPEGLVWKVGEWNIRMPVDPWVICCNTPDMQHINVVHGITFDREPHDLVQWTDHSMLYTLQGANREGLRLEFEVGIFGTSLYWQHGELGGRWFGFVAPMGLPRPGESRLFFAVAVEDDPADPDGTRAFLDAMYDLEVHIATEDLPIVEHARFRPGTLTKSDRSLARFLQYLREFPRDHPSATFIS
ncbi:aromatic ring-hydroxylating oxygenase subunit alpha [Sphingosinicella terrae]|uniref:aromatic ring-hydroxylating oxygenase subunit alpha n=1 Tax=Sphingosinicella terrae TaxID=2172047 RepID=UPI000E0CF10C|nr:Rieske 2Fe-2S domain-containing protein [Sphingosinicella terrae]